MADGGSLQGKVIVITGSTRGIGRAIAEECARQGASVVLSSRSPEATECSADEFVTSGWSASCQPCDVTDPLAIERLLAHTLERWGGLDAWVNNAGVSQGFRYADDLTPEETREVVDINLVGTMLCCHAILPYMTEHGGVILNMAGRGYRGEATPYTAVYAATKAAVLSYTRSIAAENRDAPISIDTFVPGMVETDFYVNMPVSPRLEHRAEDWRYAMDAFGVPLDVVGKKAAEVLAQEPGRSTGKAHTALTTGRTARGVWRISRHRWAGRLGSD